MLHFFLFAFGTVGVIVIVNKLFIIYKNGKKMKRKKTEVNNRKVGLFQKFQGMALPFENKSKICHLSGDEINKKIKSEELSPVDILEAFQANALIKNNELNFLADIVYEADVSSLMIDPANNQDIMGFPLSISDSLCLEKYDCTLGLLSEIHKPSIKDSIIVKILRENGAIPTLITNVGQGELFNDTNNPIFGSTVNPYNVKKTAGGSCGGLAVSIAANASLIGIGSDIKGDIRIPASFCGVFCLKPSSHRISKRYMKSIGHKQNIIENSIGIMAKNVIDLIKLFKTISCDLMFKLDPLCPPVIFNDSMFSSTKPLKIGYYMHIEDGELYPIPAIERAVLMSKKSLEHAGHELIKYQLPNINHIINKIYTQIVFSDGGHSTLKDVLKDDPTCLSLKCFICLLKLPNYIKRLLGFFVGLGPKRLGDRLSSMASIKSVYELWKLKDLIESYREEVLSSWENEKLDGLICPVLPIVAPSLNCSHMILNNNAYSVIYNLLDYVAGSVPVTQVTKGDIENLHKTYENRSKCCKKVADDHKDSLGLPVGVQCVTLPWHEEMALRIMKDLKENL